MNVFTLQRDSSDSSNINEDNSIMEFSDDDTEEENSVILSATILPTQIQSPIIPRKIDLEPKPETIEMKENKIEEEEDPNRDVNWHSIAIDIKNSKEKCGLNKEDRKLISESSCLEKNMLKVFLRLKIAFLLQLRNMAKRVYKNY